MFNNHSFLSTSGWFLWLYAAMGALKCAGFVLYWPASHATAVVQTNKSDLMSCRFRKSLTSLSKTCSDCYLIMPNCYSPAFSTPRDRFLQFSILLRPSTANIFATGPQLQVLRGPSGAGPLQDFVLDTDCADSQELAFLVASVTGCATGGL